MGWRSSSLIVGSIVPSGSTWGGCCQDYHNIGKLSDQIQSEHLRFLPNLLAFFFFDVILTAMPVPLEILA